MSFVLEVIKGIGKKLKILLLTAIATGLLLLMLLYLIPFNSTASMPYGWYLRLPATNLKVGDLVEIDNPLSGNFGIEAETGLLKKIVGIEGDLYELRGEDPEEGLLSYDSRFFGLVGKEYIRHKVVPLATFREIPEWMIKMTGLNKDI